MTPTNLKHLHNRLAQYAATLTDIQNEITTYQTLLQERHDQLTRRVERLESQVDNITNPDTVKNRKLLDDYERLMDAQAQSEEVLDDLENLVLTPLWEAQEVLKGLVS